MYNYTTNISTSPMIFEVGEGGGGGQLKHTLLSYIFMLVKQYLFSVKMYIHSMNDKLSNDVKKKITLPLTTELQDHTEKVFHNAPVSPMIEILQNLPDLWHYSGYIHHYSPRSLLLCCDDNGDWSIIYLSKIGCMHLFFFNISLKLLMAWKQGF